MLFVFTSISCFLPSPFIYSPSEANVWFVSNFSSAWSQTSLPFLGFKVSDGSELMILALISIACFSDVSNSLQAMLICARISNAIGTDAFSPWRTLRLLHLTFPEYLFFYLLPLPSPMLWIITEPQKIAHQDGWKLIEAFCQGAGLQTRYNWWWKNTSVSSSLCLKSCYQVAFSDTSSGNRQDVCKCQRLCHSPSLVLLFFSLHFTF